MSESLTTWSRRMSYVLRHEPASAGLTLDADGWADIDDLIAGLPGLDRETLLTVVAADAKQRYTVDGDRIRAAQGHSISITPMGQVRLPPPHLFHGTVEVVVPHILNDGLRPGARRDVHLSGDIDTARQVGARRGAPIVLHVDAAAAHAAGIVFRLAENGVWLTEYVPAEFITR